MNPAHSFRAIAAFLAFSIVARAATQTRTANEPAHALESLDAVLEPIRARFDVPALGAAYIEGADIVAIGAVGARARGSEAKVTVDDLWHLGSCTKAMTATVAARLVERGKLAWDTTIGATFPEWKDSIDAGWRDVPIEWLLQNRGGAPGSAPRALWSELSDRTDAPHSAREWFVGRLLRAAPEYEPGSKFEYSNQGFVIAGAMLERVAKRPWEQLMREELFEPLGMKSAGFGPPGKSGALDQPRGHAPDPVEPGPRADNPPALGPAGTVHATLGDWAKFVSAHFRGERGVDSILKAASFRKLHTSPEGQSYAMGWKPTERSWGGGTVYTHAGSNTMWYCVVWMAPEKGFALLATTNIGGDSAAAACDAAVAEVMRSRR